MPSINVSLPDGQRMDGHKSMVTPLL